MLRGGTTKAEIQRCYLSSQLHPGSEVPFKCHVSESEHTPLHLLLGFKSSSRKGEVESEGIGICIDVVDPCPPIYLYRANPEGCLQRARGSSRGVDTTHRGRGLCPFLLHLTRLLKCAKAGNSITEDVGFVWGLSSKWSNKLGLVCSLYSPPACCVTLNDIPSLSEP